MYNDWATAMVTRDSWRREGMLATVSARGSVIYGGQPRYRVRGRYTGRDIYEPASNLFLPEFKASSYSVVQRDSGWLFTPQDYYNKTQITLVNGSVASSTH